MMPYSQEQDQPDMQIIGANITQLRQEHSLSQYAFARSIGQPAWLITLMETAYMEHSCELLNLLPNSVIDQFLKDIMTVYDVGYNELTTRSQHPNYPPLSKDSIPQESLLHLPVALTPEDAMDMLDDLLEFNMTTLRPSEERTKLLSQGIRNISILFQLQLTYMKKTANEELARQNRQRFMQRFTQRVTYWESLLM